jgi:glycosyltransferase involved in cell wall biosynthesis
MNNNPKISILCPVMNVGPYLAEMIESIKNQTYQDWELIIMDGLSKDDTVDIANRYAKSDERIRVYSEKDECSWHALDKMFDLAKADFITVVCGQDGMLNSEWLERAMNVLESDKEIALVWGLAQTMNPDGNIESKPHVSYGHFIEKKSRIHGIINTIKKFFSILRELVSGNKQRRKMIIDKLFSKSSMLRINLLMQKGMPKNGVPQKQKWFWYWLETGLVFPDQSMIVSKRVWLECVPRYVLGSRTIGYMMEFYYNINAKGYLSYFLPINATFGRVHPGQSGERAGQELHDNFKKYLEWITVLNKKIKNGEEKIIFRDRDGKELK